MLAKTRLIKKYYWIWMCDYEFIIKIFINFVLHDTKNVETREDGISEIHIIHEGELWVISAFNWVCCGNNGATGLEVCDYSHFWNGNTLLFHCLVNRSSIMIIHLVELIYQTDTFVGEDEGTTLESPLFRSSVLLDWSSQTHSWGTFTSCEYTSVECLLHTLQELRFGSTLFSENEYIIICPCEFINVIFIYEIS